MDKDELYLALMWKKSAQPKSEKPVPFPETIVSQLEKEFDITVYFSMFSAPAILAGIRNEDSFNKMDSFLKKQYPNQFTLERFC